MNQYGLPKGIRFVCGAFRWEARFKGNRVTGTSHNLQDAVREREEAQLQLKGLLPNDDPKQLIAKIKRLNQVEACPTLKEVIEDIYNTDWQEGRSQLQVKHITSQIKEFFGEDTKIYEITDNRIKDFIEASQTKGNKRSTINVKLCYLSKILNRAKDKHVIKEKPVITMFKVKNTRECVISEEEEQTILNYFTEKGNMRMKNIVTFLIETGVRKNELSKITQKDFMHDKGMNGCVLLRETKNGSDRIVPLTRAARGALDELFKTSVEYGTAIYEPYQNIRYAWEKMKKAIGRENDKTLVIHSCRHTCCTRLIRNGAPIKKVQLWLGHKSIATTMRYTHLQEDDVIDLTSFLETETKNRKQA